MLFNTNSEVLAVSTNASAQIQVDFNLYLTCTYFNRRTEIIYIYICNAIEEDLVVIPAVNSLIIFRLLTIVLSSSQPDANYKMKEKQHYGL